MKKTYWANFLIPMLFVAFFCDNAYAQENNNRERQWAFGLESSTTYSSIKTSKQDGITYTNLPDDNRKFSVGALYGFNCSYRLSNKFLLIAGLCYNINSINYLQPDSYYMDSDSVISQVDVFTKWKQHCLYSYIDTKVMFSKTQNSPFVSAGLAAGYYLGTRVNHDIKLDSSSTIVSSFSEKARYTNHNNWNYFIRLGLGYDLALNSNLFLSAHIIHNQSLRNLLSDDILFNTNHKIHFTQIGLQLTFKL